MKNLQLRQEKIELKRRNTSWRDFIKEIGSWQPINLYKVNNLISRYPSTSRTWEVIHSDIFEKDISDGPIVIGADHWSFMNDLQLLFRTNPLPNLHQSIGADNSDYTDWAWNVKNCYLSFIISMSENVLYSFSTKTHITNVISSVAVRSNCNNIFDSFYVTNSSNVFFSRSIHNSYNTWFCENMTWCQNCILCHDLENISYCIRNKQYSVEDYNKLSQEIVLNKEKFKNYKSDLHGSLANVKSEWSIGNWLFSTNKLTNGLICASIESGNNVFMTWWESLKTNYFDVFCWGRWDYCYGTLHAANFVDHIYCSALIYNSSSIFYSYYLDNCSFCLWCVWLKNKSYCILNKQYTKEERYAKVDEIFTQMERKWQLWEFFPATMNPFYFNDTAAYLIDPSFTKEEVTKLWYLRRDEPIKVDIPEWAITVQSSELDQFESLDEQWNWRLDETVCKRVILDENGDAYRIIPMELEFLQKHGLPLPRKHWLTRMKENFRIN